MGLDSSAAGLCLLQSRRAREPGDQLRELSRPGQSHAGDVRREADEHEMVPRMSPYPENFLRPEDQITNLDWKPEDVNPAEFVAKYGKPAGVTEDWSKKTHLTQQEIGQTLKERWNIRTSENCQACHR